MRTLVNWNTTPVDLNVLLPDAASTVTAANRIIQFIKDAHYRSLKVTYLKKEENVGGRAEYDQLLSGFPTSTMKKLPPQQLRTQEGQARAITQLVSKHSGEVVELDPREHQWRLVSCKEKFDHPQLRCTRDGATRSSSQDGSLTAYDCGYIANQESLDQQREQARVWTTLHKGCTVDTLLPNWQQQ